MLKRIILTCTVLVITLFSVSAQTHEEGKQKMAQIKFETLSHDFGNIKQKDTPHVYEFAFTNTGDAPLVITRAELSCKCTSVTYPRKPVAPGQSATVTVTYTPKNELGTFDNTIKVYSNAADRRVILNIQGKVVKR